MKVEGLERKIRDLELKYDALKDNIDIFQQNINNNITWFYAILAIIVATIGVALYFLVKNAVSIGVEKGIEKTHKKIEDIITESRQFEISKGNSNILDNKIHVAGFPDYIKENIVSVTVITKHGQILDNINVIISDNGYITIQTFGLKDFQYVYWTIVWIANETNR